MPLIALILAISESLRQSLLTTWTPSRDLRRKRSTEKLEILSLLFQSLQEKLGAYSEARNANAIQIEEIRKLIEELCSELSQGIAGQLPSLLLELFEWYSTNAHKLSFSDYWNSPVQKMCTFLAQHIYSRHSIGLMAASLESSMAIEELAHVADSYLGSRPWELVYLEKLVESTSKSLVIPVRQTYLQIPLPPCSQPCGTESICNRIFDILSSSPWKMMVKPSMLSKLRGSCICSRHEEFPGIQYLGMFVHLITNDAYLLRSKSGETIHGQLLFLWGSILVDVLEAPFSTQLGASDSVSIAVLCSKSMFGRNEYDAFFAGRRTNEDNHVGLFRNLCDCIWDSATALAEFADVVRKKVEAYPKSLAKDASPHRKSPKKSTIKSPFQACCCSS